jgi:hypothetical protein
MNTGLTLRRKISLTVAAVAATVATTIGAVPAHASVTGVIAPISIDIPPTAPTTFSAQGNYVGSGRELIHWNGESAGTGVGPVEFHWWVVSDSCHNSWTLNNDEVTQSHSILMTVQTGCAYTIGVATWNVDHSGSYLRSAAAYFSFVANNDYPTAPAIAKTPMNLINGVVVQRNFRNSGYTRLTWNYQGQPLGTSNFYTVWAVMGSSQAGDPMWLHDGGEFGNTVMLKLTSGVTYNVSLYLYGLRQGGVVAPSGAYRVDLTFVA